MYVPLLFFFNRSAGQALPMIGLSFHEVKIHLTLNDAHDVPGIDGTQLDIQLYCDYIYLSEDERRRFARNPQELLIQQVQFTGSESTLIDMTANKAQNVRLNFNHPVVMLAWVCVGSLAYKYTAGDLDSEACAPIKDIKIQLNGHDRFSTRFGSYFNKVQPFQHGCARARAGVYMYSFGLRPTDLQSTGTLNMSRIDNTTLQLTYKKANGTVLLPALDEESADADIADLKTLNIFAVNFNVLRI